MRCSSPSQGPYLTYRRPYERDHRARLDGGLLDIVGDTGVGLPEGLDVHAAESLGWQLVRILTEQLRGTIALEGHRGTTVTITFPLWRPPSAEDSGRLCKSSRASLCRDVEPGNNGNAVGPGGLRAYV